MACCNARQGEIDARKQNKTWKLVVLPKGRKAIGCKWMYRVKTNLDGSVAQYKARLVAQGCTQISGVDYDETFSPVVRHESIQTVLAIVA